MASTSGRRAGVLLAAGGATWEAERCRSSSDAGVVVLKRCVDLHDLMASATSGQAEVAVVSADVQGLDADAVMHLLRYDVRTVAVIDSVEQHSSEQAERLGRLGVVRTTFREDIEGLGEAHR